MSVAPSDAPRVAVSTETRVAQTRGQLRQLRVAIVALAVVGIATQVAAAELVYAARDGLTRRKSPRAFARR